MKKLILLVCFFVAPVHAALFEDTEARKKLQEMQLKETELEARIVSLEAVIKSGSLTDMLNQIELVKQDVSKLRGDIETLRHLNATVEQRQKDLYQDLDGRLRKIEEKSAINNPAASNKGAETSPATEIKVSRTCHSKKPSSFLRRAARKLRRAVGYSLPRPSPGSGSKSG